MLTDVSGRFDQERWKHKPVMDSTVLPFFQMVRCWERRYLMFLPYTHLRTKLHVLTALKWRKYK